jgi:hypothetical protein
MQVVLEELDLPEKGSVELKMHRFFEIRVTAEEARRKVNRWLSWEVSMLISADPPILVIDKNVIWRVPVWLGVLRYGRLGVVGAVDVDVQTGEMHHLSGRKAEIERCAHQLAKSLPPFQPFEHVPDEFIPKDVPPAPRLILIEE